MSEVIEKSDYQIEGITVRFENVVRNGSRVQGNVTVEWEEHILGNRIVIVRQTFPFDIEGRQRIWEDSIDIIWGVRLKAYIDVYVQGTNEVCIEARATWPGGNAGKIECKSF